MYECSCGYKTPSGGLYGEHITKCDGVNEIDRIRSRLAEVEKERNWLKDEMRYINKFYDMPLRVKKVSSEGKKTAS